MTTLYDNFFFNPSDTFGITASYTMSVTPPIDTNILNTTTSWLGWAGLIASVSLTAINAVYRWYKNKKNNVGGGGVI